GTLMLEGQPAVNERIIAGNHGDRYSEAGRRFNFVSFYFETKTDAAGKFSFQKVPPGRCNLFRQPLRSHTGFESHETSVVLNAGGVTQVTLGGTGRPVVGKAVLVGDGGLVDWQSVPVLLRSKAAPDSPRPRRADFPSAQEYVAAAEKFFEAARSQRRFGAFCERNGSFRLPDIPAGVYELEIQVRDATADSVGSEEHFGSVKRDVIVPESSEGRAHEPVEVGTLELARVTGAAK
ncbi:MAG TPA: carboxypeptidase-like regulatory domain-containing protein, partial [Candidatus Dormibacteraeota bacterium]|nr:carboxypeptidase-like regulatory domain-containing protein [Candidatus Dormibacteraeota bacterium]